MILDLAGIATVTLAFLALLVTARMAARTRDRRLHDLTRQERSEAEARKTWPPSPTDPSE